MKHTRILLAICLIATSQLWAQGSDTTINILKAPASPAANLLGISPSDVQKPTDPSAFMVSVQSATGNYSSIPSSYAVDIAPAWLFNGQHITYNHFLDNGNVRRNICQSLVLSAATKSDSAKNTIVGLGIKFSLLRGHVNHKALDDQKQILQITSEITKQSSTALRDLVMTDRFRNADPATRNHLKDSVYNAVIASINASPEFKPKLDSLKTIATNIDFSRYGWKLDFAGGISALYPNQQFNSGTVQKAGAWFTGGYEDESGVSILGIVRYLYNPDHVFADNNATLRKGDINTLDAGARVLYGKGKFTGGGEFIYRSAFAADYTINPTWRFTLNVDYKVGSNQLLTLALGRDYDGTFNKDGNVIAALNLVLGFGNHRPVN